MHGANRLGGNSLSDLLVFGKRAGEFAAKKSKEVSQGAINQDEVEHEAADALRYFGDGQGENPYAIHEELRATMQSLVGIVRTDEDLRAALGKINELRERSLRAKVGGNIQYNPGWHLAMDLKNMLDISEACTKSALERKESRGGHTREDFPDYDPEWEKVNCIARQTKDGINVKAETRSAMPAELAEIVKGGGPSKD
jgi:succinate dehydrogenase / fumarate reductase flavoprotein subunit